MATYSLLLSSLYPFSFPLSDVPLQLIKPHSDLMCPGLLLKSFAFKMAQILSHRVTFGRLEKSSLSMWSGRRNNRNTPDIASVKFVLKLSQRY